MSIGGALTGDVGLPTNPQASAPQTVPGGGLGVPTF